MEPVVERAWSGAGAVLSGLRRSPPPAGSWSSVVWVAAIGLVFFFLSNPLALQPNFYISLERAVWVVVLAVLLTLPWFRFPRLPWAVALLLLMMVTSMTWSISPSVTWFAFELYLKLAIVGLVCAACAAPRTVALGLAFGGVIVVVTSVQAYLDGNPAVLVPPGTDGYLAGVGTNRNILSYTLILSFAAALAAVPRRWWARAAWAMALLVISVGLFLAQSGTGFVAVGVLVASAGALAGIRRWRGMLTRRGRHLLSAGAVVLGVAAVLGWPALGVVLGRDSSTLSGRTDLWAATWQAAEDDRLLGQGWGTVWGHPWAPAPVNHMFDVIYFATSIPYTHGHNSLFDVLPELGLVGVLLVLLAHLAVLYRWWTHTQLLATSPSADDGWAAARLGILGVLALALFGVTEPMATIPLGWFVLVLLSGLKPATRVRYKGAHAARRRVSGAQATTS